MTRLRKRNMVITLMLIVMMLASSISVDAASAKVWTKGANAPSTLVRGQSFSVKGTIKANKKIKKVEIGIVNSSNNWTKYKYTKKNVNSKKFKIKKADKKLKFGKLAEGKYNYRIYVRTKDKKVTCVMDQPFYVVGKNGSAPATTTTSAPVATSDGYAIASQAADVSLSNANFPGDYNVGRAFNIRGIVSSDEIITRVEAGITVTATNKWTDYKYDSVVLAKSFDLSRAASSLRFDKLPGGQFTYRVYVHTTSGVKIVINRSFKVTPSNKPQAAVNWAINIANDDSFTYGKKPETSKIGCYFCGTNQKRKPAGYEKTYVCCTFAGAAYAHGAGDPDLHNACKKAKMTIYENNYNFSKFNCWMKIGSCRDLTVNDLLPGDVVIDWSDSNGSDGHVWIYVGGDQLVDSEGYGWQAKSIAVRNGAAKKLASYGNSSSKNYVMRYIK